MIRTAPLLIFALLGLPAAVYALTDPTRPQDYVAPLVASATSGDGEAGIEVVEPGYRLQYVLVSDQRRYAVINGKRVQEGEQVGDARVLRIGPGVVRIHADGKTQDLRLGYKDIKISQGRGSR